MATPTDQRLLELLEKWLKSLELHLKYSSLDGDSYSKIQPWPEHQRPSRWIIELAKQKALSLQAQVQERVKLGDTKFADSLELMMFLANLVAAEHIERFIPMASAESEQIPTPPAASAAEPVAADAATGTREMPKFVVGRQRAPAPPSTPKVTRSERKPPKEPARAAAPTRQPPAKPATVPEVAVDAAHEQVIADAARLVQWGRKWYELAELISGMAGRPSLIDVRRILKDNKAVIDKKAGGG
jgi:hypothetical protein